MVQSAGWNFFLNFFVFTKKRFPPNKIIDNFFLLHNQQNVNDKTKYRRKKTWNFDKNLNIDKTTKLKLWENWTIDTVTKPNLWQKSQTGFVTKPNVWENSKTQIIIKLKNSNGEKINFYLNCKKNFKKIIYI